MKTCVKCKIAKDLNDFSNNKAKKDGKCVYCRSCYAIVNKEWRKNNPDKDKKIHEKWKQNNLHKVRKNNLKSYYNNHEKRKSKSREYKKNNKSILKIKHKLYTNKKYYEDIEYRLKILIRGRMWKAIKRNSKQSSSLSLLGCSINNLKIHLEKQFVSGMNWDNYGKWHIDHILPCASFDLTDPEQQKKCFHYTNLQPLWAKDNIRKRDKII
jgi:hypothetical protein